MTTPTPLFFLRRLCKSFAAAISLSASSSIHAAKITHADLCIYGGSSGGVAAAVQGARMGKQVVVVEPGRHLGGMTAGGLSAVDIGEPRSVGGIAREYFTRLAATTGTVLAWDEPFKSKAGGPATGGAYAIEPHKAEQLFRDMLSEARVPAHFNARLASVKKDGARITEIVMEDGDVFRAKVFVDTTYEGDLMAKAGVTCTLTREGNATHGESYNGIHYSEKFAPRTRHLQPGPSGRVPGGQGVWDRDLPLDPYVVKGDPKSGLLPLINEGDPGNPGDPAPGVQAYCFRLCLTTAADRIPITPPPDYDPKSYELVARFIEACLANGDDMDLRWFSKHDPLPNDKWDFNTATFGGNLPGASWEWPEATCARREHIAKEHENYHRGLLHFLATDPRVPEKVRKDMQRFGLPKDEFTDNGGWPHQIYIREARRMVSDLVMTEHHTFGRTVAPDSVGLGSYGTDTHEIRRIVKDGIVIREGKTAMGRDGAPPYPIGYAAIVPKQVECDNLFVTFALSASHTAFSSIRMEPVFMVTSQSAATAACLAIDGNVPVQKVPYAELKKRLEADGQVLRWMADAKPVPEQAFHPAGIVVDDSEAVLTGTWVESTKQPSYVGQGYRHDNHEHPGTKTARFTPPITEAGSYEVRLLYPATSNRATNIQVTIEGPTGGRVIRVNQRESCMDGSVPRALGEFRFEPGKSAAVTISNADADGYVVVDAVQFVPIAIADAERAGQRASGFTAAPQKPSAQVDEHAAKRVQMAAAAALSPLAPVTSEGRLTAPPSSEPVRLARDAKPVEVNGRRYDLIVVGATAGGVACAVRAARDGCTVLLVQHNRHIGGMMTNGLMQWDALHGGPRAPLFSELLRNIEKDAITRFGRDSKVHQAVRYTHEHYPVGWGEPHVVEREFNRLVAGEKNITLLLSHYPIAIEREGALLEQVTFREYGTTSDIRVQGLMFADATYEGDLLALAKVPCRVGREARDEYQEPHAGKVFVNIDSTQAPADAVQGRLNIRPYGSRQGSVDPSSPFSADGAVQAYNYRFCVTRDPANRILPATPPPGYDRREYVNYDRKSISTNAGPNLKSHMNSPILPGENHAYPEADWPARERIIERHKNFALGLMWFLQNDESVPEAKRAGFREWGLPRDEFADHGHIPYEMYVREARRIVGRHVFTEHDCMLAKGIARTPVHSDSIAITDWYMDSHSCTPDSRPGYHYDGKLILTEESRPSQIPYRCLLPQSVDNLLVPVCLSATHVAWGAVRLEPVWMQTGEAAGVAAALAKRLKSTPAALKPELLLRTLVERRHLVSFFNDVKVDADDPRIPAAEYFATKGFFHDYNARLREPLKESTGRLWSQALTKLIDGAAFDPQALAQSVAQSEVAEDLTGQSTTRGDVLLEMWRKVANHD